MAGRLSPGSAGRRGRCCARLSALTGKGGGLGALQGLFPVRGRRDYLKVVSDCFEQMSLKYYVVHVFECVRPYHVENTSSRLITEVKQHWAVLVLGWVTAWEYTVLYSFLTSIC